MISLTVRLIFMAQELWRVAEHATAGSKQLHIPPHFFRAVSKVCKNVIHMTYKYLVCISLNRDDPFHMNTSVHVYCKVN